jgi:Cdc6-like AAA superfamily ATPase
MILRPEVFDENHLPRTLMHREGEGEVIADAVRGAGAGEPADSVLISGTSGVGKTVLAKHTLCELERQRGVPWTHIRTMGATRGTVFREAIAGHPRGSEPATNTPVADLETQLRDLVDAPYVVVLDEADDLARTDIPGTLLEVDQLSIMVICHDPQEWRAAADPRVERALDRRLHLERFSTRELTDILRRRADHGLQSHVVSPAKLERIADEVAGIARRGIQSLRAAAELAGERGHERIATDDVDDCFERARQAIREANLSSLTYHHQLIYGCVFRRGTMSSREIHDRYDEHAGALYQDVPLTPISRRDRRTKLNKLVEYDLVVRDGPDNDPQYHVRDGELEPAVELPNPAE